MKKYFLGLSVILAVLILMPSCLNPDSSGNTEDETNSDTTETSDEVQIVFDLVNEFRTGNEAYYWNKDNTTKTDLVGKLGKLTLDENLCKAAQIRADELLENFDHTRPNGDDCFSVLTDLGISYSGVGGENIAAGNQSGKKTFTQWKEDDEDYSGQGHRRNMLGDFTKIGIAFSYDASSKYKYYWAMILIK